MLRPVRRVVLAVAVLLTTAAGTGRAQLTISLVPDAGLSANGPALASFQRAAAEWTSQLTTAAPVTVVINAGLSNLGSSNIIGQTGSSSVAQSYSSVRTALVNHNSALQGPQILSSLPATFTATVPGGVTLNAGSVRLNTATAKALGFTPSGTSDATITFNSQFAFTYDRSSGVAANTVDFQTVACHEIGHALGFVSAVDNVDGGSTSITPRPLDLFRFNAANAPTTATDFQATARDLRAGVAAVTADTVNSFNMSTGTSTGDGYQASHWKHDSLNGGVHIGIMDPAVGYGVYFDPTAADLRAFELMGYTLMPVPEPAAVLAAAAAGLLATRAARRRAGPALAA